MKKEVRLIKAYGKNNIGMADLPYKVSGVTVSRILLGDDIGCSFDFPHGFDAVNSRYEKLQRNWKKQRKTKWK